MRCSAKPNKLVALATVASLAVATLSAHRALAYRTIADLPEFSDSERVVWAGSVLRFYVSSYDLPQGVSLDALSAEALSSFEAWESPGCSHVVIEHGGDVAAAAVPGDGANTVQFITSGWEARGYLADQAGATELEFGRTGEGWAISEADLFINAEHFSWSIDGDGDTRSLRTLLIHEGGHMLGLLHPCEPGEAACDGQTQQASVMHPFYDESQVDLGADDEAGICSLYGGCTGKDCAESPECVSNADCGHGQICQTDGTCATDRLEVGEPCGETSECDSGYCNEYYVCAGVPHEFGATCDSANDCVSSQCLAGAADTGICTNLCTSSAECPGDTYCAQVEDRTVCVPPLYVVAGGGGCNVQPTRQPPPHAAGWAAVALLAMAAARRRKRALVRDLFCSNVSGIRRA